MRLLSEESCDTSSDAMDKEMALVKGVDVMELSMETSPVISQSKKEKHCEYEHECREKHSTAKSESDSEVVDVSFENQLVTNCNVVKIEEMPSGSDSKLDEKPVEEVRMLSYQKKVIVLYELLSACLSDLPVDKKKSTRRRKGYDARHRVALRLLTTWFDINWTKMVCILDLSILISCLFCYNF